MPWLAYDIGPANALIDAAAWRATGADYDRDGSLAAAGRVDSDLLAALLADPYYALPPPKTTGKELFNLAYLDAFLAQRSVSPADVVATVTALTAEVVAASIKHHGIDTVIASGGGCANPTLMAMLRSRLDGVTVTTSDTLGAPADSKEAIAFALLGYYTAHGLPGNVPSCTGATGPRILGTLTPGLAQLRLPEPLSPSPTSLRLSRSS
jgi:anhydro-N-acetylmuramic acid kinase